MESHIIMCIYYIYTGAYIMLHLPNNSYPIWHKTIIHCTSTWDLSLAQRFQYLLFRILLFGISPGEEFSPGEKSNAWDFSCREIRSLGFLVARNPLVSLGEKSNAQEFSWREIHCLGFLPRSPRLGVSFGEKSAHQDFTWRNPFLGISGGRKSNA